MKVFGEFKKQNFQRLRIFLAQDGGNIDMRIPLPFTINKFTRSLDIDVARLDYFWEESHELMRTSVELDQEILQSFYEIHEIFPKMQQIDQNEFIHFLDFGQSDLLLINLIVETPTKLQMIIRGKRPQDVFLEYVRWFKWIFSRS